MEALGLTEAQYEIDFDSATAVKDVQAAQQESKDGKTYDLLGRPADEDASGVVIRDGKTILQK